MRSGECLDAEREETALRVVAKVLRAAAEPGAVVWREDGDDENPDWIVVISPSGELTSCFLFDFEDQAARIADLESGVTIVRAALERRR